MASVDTGASPKPVCVECEEAKRRAQEQEAERHRNEHHILDLGVCSGSYLEVDACMKRHNGNVADCTDVWKMFNECHKRIKVPR